MAQVEAGAAVVATPSVAELVQQTVRIPAAFVRRRAEARRAAPGFTLCRPAADMAVGMTGSAVVPPGGVAELVGIAVSIVAAFVLGPAEPRRTPSGVALGGAGTRVAIGVSCPAARAAHLLAPAPG